MHVLAFLAGVHPCTISPAIKHARELLRQQGITIAAGPARLTTLAGFHDHAAAAGITLPGAAGVAAAPLPHPGTTRPEQ